MDDKKNSQELDRRLPMPDVRLPYFSYTGDMLYTWAVLPARIDSKDEAVQILDALMATRQTYTLDELKTVLESLFVDNKMQHAMVATVFNFQSYGDYALYASSGTHIHFNLYVFCAGYKIDLPSTYGGRADAYPDADVITDMVSALDDEPKKGK